MGHYHPVLPGSRMHFQEVRQRHCLGFKPWLHVS